MDPVLPRMDRFFLKLEPSNDLRNVKSSASGVSIGEQGDVQPGERAWRDVEVWVSEVGV